MDRLALVRHGLHKGYEAAAVLFTAAAVAAMCFSGAILTAIHGEKAQPWELAVTAPGYMAVTEQTLLDCKAIAGVTGAAGIVEVPVTAVSGKYTAGLTLVGIDGAYLDELAYIEGDLFPAGGAMPWLVLSKAAARTFTDPDDKTQHTADYMPDVDWLNAGLSLDMGGSVISARISGIFEGDEPAAYISADMAKSLLQAQGLPSGYTGARVRVTDIGAAEAVSQAITDMGYLVTNRDSARQENWDARTREAVYLAILAGAGFLCAGMLRLTGAALGREEKRRRNDALRWAGMSAAAIRNLDILRGIYLALIGAVLGIAAHYLIAALVGLNL